MDPIYLYFDGDEQSYLRYTQMARDGERPSSRDAGNPVQVGLANEEGFPHAGTVDFVDNQLNPQTGTIRARAVLQNKDGQFTPGSVCAGAAACQRRIFRNPDRGSRGEHRSKSEIRAAARREQQNRISQSETRPGDRRSAHRARGIEGRRCDRRKRCAARASRNHGDAAASGHGRGRSAARPRRIEPRSLR